VSALWVALATALIKEALYRATYRVGTELRAPSLLASARDHRADVWAAGTVCAGVLGARAGVWWIDPMAALCIGLYIAWMAWEPIRANLGVLTDEADPKRAATIRTVILEDDAVLAVPSIRVHPFGAYDRVEVEITVDGRSSLQSAHQVAHRAEDRVIERVAHVRAVHVHVNPQDEI
jgi:cation diffusion facilitator family transporter